MSLEAQHLVDMIKKTAKMAVDEGAPFSFCIGKVLTENPLKIKVDQKLILGEKQLILTNAVRDYYVKLTTVGEELNQEDGKEHYTEYEERKTTNPVYGVSGAPDDNNAFEEHRHEYKGDKWWKVNLGLKTGESVQMFRIDGGQKYVVLDRVYPPNNRGEIK